jgi:hypothetical protein
MDRGDTRLQRAGDGRPVLSELVGPQESRMIRGRRSGPKYRSCEKASTTVGPAISRSPGQVTTLS